MDGVGVGGRGTTRNFKLEKNHFYAVQSAACDDVQISHLVPVYLA